MIPSTPLTYEQQLARLQRFIEADETPDTDAVDALFIGRDGSAPRLDVYRHAYRARLTEALRTNHPMLHRAMGDEAFATLANDYVAAHPSHHPSIRWFGHRLADWAALTEALPHPALLDLARMEWALGLAFDSADANAMDPAELGRVLPGDWPALRLRPHPSVQCLSLDWAIEPLWRALTDDPEAQTDPPEPLRHDLLIWRRGFDTRWRSVPPHEAHWIRGLLAGQSLRELLDPEPPHTGSAPIDDAIDPAAEFTTALHRWLAEGWLAPTHLASRNPAMSTLTRSFTHAFTRFATAAVLLGAALTAHALEVKPYSAEALAAAQKAQQPVALHFHADWCPTCRAQSKVLEELKTEPGLDVTVLTANYDREKDLKRQLGVRSQSTFIVYKGTKETARSTGETDRSALVTLLKSAR